MDNNKTKHRLSGGELTGPEREAFLAMRKKILLEDDVHDVLGLSFLEEEGRWLYLIKTPFASGPKYVIGNTDPENTDPQLICRCGTEWSAMIEWEKITWGGH
jgi:hypothetical protein